MKQRFLQKTTALLLAGIFLLLTACDTTPLSPPTPACGSGDNPHQFTELSRSEPTCTSDGVIQHTCTQCGIVQTEYTPALGHDFKVNIHSYATVKQAGEETRTCLRCSHSETVTIPAIRNATGSFSKSYAEAGVPFSYNVDGVPAEHLKYIWSYNDRPFAFTPSVTPDETDAEQFLSVRITDRSGNLVASDRLWFSRLPVLYINTDDGNAIQSKSFKGGSMSLQGNTRFDPASTPLYSGRMQIRGRGNSTWNFEKKPYKIKLDQGADLFHFGKSKHWVLLANYLDESLLRNTVAYNMAYDLGMTSMQTTWVDVVLNGVPQGVYQLCEEVKISEDRVDIFDWEDAAEQLAKGIYKENASRGFSEADRDWLEEELVHDLSWITSGTVTFNSKTYRVSDYVTLPKKTGGFLIEMSREYDEATKFKLTNDVPFMLKNPEYLSTNTTLYNYVKEYLSAIDRALFSPTFTTTYKGKTVSWMDLVDIDSLVRFWFVSEFFHNEIGNKSTFLYMDIGGKLCFGPVWDFDFASGSNSPWGAPSAGVWCTKNRWWFSQMIRDPKFVKILYEFYPTFEPLVAALLEEGGSLDQSIAYLAEAGAYNSKLWPNRLGTEGRPRGFEKDARILRDWIRDRKAWMDAQFSSLRILTAALGANGNVPATSPTSLTKGIPQNIGTNGVQRLETTVLTPGGSSVPVSHVQTTNSLQATIPSGVDALTIQVYVKSVTVYKMFFYVNGTYYDSVSVPNPGSSICTMSIPASLLKEAQNEVFILGIRNDGHENNPYHVSLNLKKP